MARATPSGTVSVSVTVSNSPLPLSHPPLVHHSAITATTTSP
ncbi:hypothetical protein CISIN_1g0409892mg, partial [Citrus sinensis]